MAAAWVAVDWGTSNLRAWGIDARGAVVFARESAAGMARLEPDGYGPALRALLADDLPADGPRLDVLICGMAGARQGWREAPYLDVPAELGGLALAAVAPDGAGPRLAPRILPGLCQKGAAGEDVMRGEETQLLGLTAMLPEPPALVVMPGTHCKWAQLDGRRVTGFTTAMTGEIYQLLLTHSVLRHSAGGGDGAAEAQDEGFRSGLAVGLEVPQRLLGGIFRVRAASLLSGRDPAWCTGHLSGLLIGSEIGGLRQLWQRGTVPLVGGAALSRRYAQAFAAAGIETLIVPAADAVLAGLKAARRALGEAA